MVTASVACTGQKKKVSPSGDVDAFFLLFFLFGFNLLVNFGFVFELR
jgi:hypothetical protein